MEQLADGMLCRRVFGMCVRIAANQCVLGCYQNGGKVCAGGVYTGEALVSAPCAVTA